MMIGVLSCLLDKLFPFFEFPLRIPFARWVGWLRLVAECMNEWLVVSVCWWSVHWLSAASSIRCLPHRHSSNSSLGSVVCCAALLCSSTPIRRSAQRSLCRPLAGPFSRTPLHLASPPPPGVDRSALQCGGSSGQRSTAHRFPFFSLLGWPWRPIRPRLRPRQPPRRWPDRRDSGRRISCASRSKPHSDQSWRSNR